MGKGKFQTLARKTIAGQATPEERRQLNETAAVKRLMIQQWKEGSHASKNEEIEQRIWKQILIRCKWEKQQTHRIHQWIYAAAAVMLLIGISWVLCRKGNDKQTACLETMAEKPRMLRLPDESKIWMQSGTSVRYNQTFDKSREVWMKGDATFEVAKQNGHPFKVYIGKAFVKVKGTVFCVNNRNEEVSKITLYKGKVDFHAGTGKKVVAMKPDQCLHYYPNGEISFENISHINWQEGTYKFHDTRLDSLINIINRLYETNVELAENVPRNSLFNGRIRYDEHPAEIAEKICYIMDLKYKQENNKLIIYKPEEKKKIKSN